MQNPTDLLILIGALLTLVFSGIHIAVALGLCSMLGLFMMTGDMQGMISFASSTAYEALRDYVFAVIPLFMLMGEFLAKCGAARDLFTLVNRSMHRIRGRLGTATVLANALFAFVTGVSIAAAAAFSKIAYPEMRRHGYERKFALGCIAGSACLGMLIPPSVLMIVWGVLTELSIGKLFIAGIIPGVLVVVLYIGYIVWVAYTQPHRVGEGPNIPAVQQKELDRENDVPEADLRAILWSTVGIVALIVIVLGGIWFGFFTPTEGAGVGATLALALAMSRGMKPKEMLAAVISVGRTSAPLLLLLVTAQLYSRVLSMTGVTGMAQDFFSQSGLSPYTVLLLMVLVWFVLGMLIDSISIILLTVPVFAPVAMALGFDPIAFAILGILAIETGLLTPPFGILVFTVKASIPDEPDLKNGEIFRGCIPYWIVLLIAIVTIAVFPALATWLPNLALANP
ncbi:MAG: TRAP transporter large permease [Hydrogenophaga sp.]|jgi:tripartite ATP-independent transporter DctM subunit|uniref:TRAP transporter large permease n=1 Tax=Hydrogenophaga sp. TaxID=1904254 RepID=UPI001DF5DD60|nr:TRAP transporter large permease [Hydrogenophaga sp.]MBW0169772.1 TRAP transporter large permease [Hydrogenophaga sp.]MBW0182237.1 TRAP transporter large permease [Hydrogenophaga sp.]